MVRNVINACACFWIALHAYENATERLQTDDWGWFWFAGSFALWPTFWVVIGMFFCLIGILNLERVRGEWKYIHNRDE